MVRHARHLLDDLGDPGQGPQIGAKTVGPGTQEQHAVEFLLLYSGQARLAAKSIGTAKSFCSTVKPVIMPALHALTADAQLAGNLSLAVLAAGKQSRRMRAPPPELHRIPWRVLFGVHGHNIAHRRLAVTILCEPQ